MTVPDNNEPTTDQGPDEGTVENRPAYAEYLDQFPDSLRGTAEGVFQKWDKSVGERFQKVHSDYEPYKAYEPFVKQNIPVAELEQAYSILNRIREDPRSVYDTLGESFGYNAPPVAEQGPVGNAAPGIEDGEYDPFSDPRFTGQEELVRTMAEAFLSQQQAAAQAELDAQINSEITALVANNGYTDDDLKVVLSMATSTDATLEEAAQTYNKLLEQKFASMRAPKAPVILGGGGGSGVSTEPVNASKMSPADTRKMVAEMLRNANQE